MAYGTIRLPTAYCLLLTAYCLLPTAYCLLAYCLLPVTAKQGVLTMKCFACSGSLALMLASIITATVLLSPGVARTETPEWVMFALPYVSVDALAIDAEGNIWIGGGGSEEGELVKFDGVNWTVYDHYSTSVFNETDMVIDAQGNVWKGVDSAGMAKFDGVNWTVYNPDNSGLPGFRVSALTFDMQGNLWIGTESGVAKFDGVNWTVYDAENSGLPANNVDALVFDVQGNLWIGTESGVAKFDGVNWTVYDAENSGLPANNVDALVFDVQGNLWIGTWVGGLAKFDGVNWTVYNTNNSELPGNIHVLVIGVQGELWIGTRRGLAKFDGTNWTVHNTNNSELPGNEINDLAIDAKGNLWIGTWYRVAVYREGGVILPSLPTDVEETRSTEVPSAFSLSQNHPNPFNPETTITYDIAETGTVRLSVYALTGQLVRTLIDGERPAGSYSLTWDGTDDAGRDVASGVYVCRMEAGDYRAVRKLVLVQ